VVGGLAVAETIKLDPSAVATSRTEIDLTPFIGDEGVDWGDATIEAYMAQAERGSIPVDFTIPNRTVTVPLVLTARGTVTFETIRRQLQAKVGLFQREGGWLSRVTTAGTLYADVVNSTLRLGGDWMQSNRSIDIGAQLSLELSPDWYGAEITLDSQTETTAPEFAKVLKLSGSDAVVAGDYPGRVRIAVDEDDGDAQLGLLWGFRSRYYDSAVTAALAYQAGSLTPLDTAGTATISGAAGTVMQHTSLSTGWTPVVSTQILVPHDHMTHKGSYRVWARCYSTSATPPQVRFVWRVGELVNPEANDPKAIPAASSFYVLDLGEIRLDPPPTGIHRWQGVIQAGGAAGGENVSVDRLWFQPLDDGAGRLTASVPSEDLGLATFSARDEFNQSAGALAGKTLPVGGTWAAAGDADDFTVETTGKTAQRVATADAVTGVETGHFGLAGTNTYATIAVQADIRWTFAISGGPGIFARYTDTSNFLVARIATNAPPLHSSIIVTKRVAGVSTVIATTDVGPLGQAAYYRLRLVIDSGGRVWCWLSQPNSAAGSPRVAVQDSALATGGALASGRVGIYEWNASSVAEARNYDNFKAWVPVLDAVLNAGRNAELRTEGMFHEDLAGTTFALIPSVGVLPRIPPAGLENRKVELFLKDSRGDFDQLPDFGIDDIAARVYYRPSWLIAPGS